MGLEQIINVSISRETQAVSQAGFGTPMILGVNATFSGNIQTYTSLADVLSDFASSTGEYKAASRIFGQSPKVVQLKIGKMLSKVAQIETLTPDVSSQTVQHFIVTIDGVAYDFTSDSSPTAAEVVTGLKALINADADCLMAATGTTTLILTAETAGEPSVVSASTNLTIAHTAANVGVVESLAAISLVDDDWYGLVYTGKTNADILQVAAYIEGVQKIYAVSKNDAGCIDPASTTDIAYLLKASSFFRTLFFYSGDTANFPEAALMGRCLPLIPGSETWAYKTLSSVVVDQLSGTAIGALKAKNANYYIPMGGKSITLEGKVAGGEFIDVIRLIDLLAARMQEEIFGTLTLHDKLPFTNGGIAAVENDVQGVLKSNQKTGGIAPDDIDSKGDLVPGFTTSFPKVSDISTSDRANRKLTGGLWSARIAGAIHAVEINGTVTV